MCVYDWGAWRNAMRKLSDLPDQIRKEQGSRTPEQQETADEISERIEAIITKHDIVLPDPPKYTDSDGNQLPPFVR